MITSKNSPNSAPSFVSKMRLLRVLKLCGDLKGVIVWLGSVSNCSFYTLNSRGGGSSFGGKRNLGSLWGTFGILEILSETIQVVVVNKRSYRDTLHLLRDLSKRMNRQVTPVIKTDGLKFYERVNGRVFVLGCLCGLEIKRAGTIAWSKSSEEPLSDLGD